MTIIEFSNQFDILYNNITSNQAPGLNEYEKSVFLTKAQDEIVKNYFEASSLGNTVKKGFDDTILRQMDFSSLMTTKEYQDGIIGESTLDPRAIVYDIPENTSSFGYAPDVKLRLSSKKLRNLGWEPQVDLQEAYERTIKYLS